MPPGSASWIVEPTTGINLHNRGLGFSLEPGHPAELGPGRRPPHTLSPALATRDGELVAVLGTMGGDAQPQIVRQLAARLFVHRQRAGGGRPRRRAGCCACRGPDSTRGRAAIAPKVIVEAHAPPAWRAGLIERGHAVDGAPAFDSAFGHAHVITQSGGVLTAAADPRAAVGSAAAL